MRPCDSMWQNEDELLQQQLVNLRSDVVVDHPANSWQQSLADYIVYVGQKDDLDKVLSQFPDQLTHRDYFGRTLAHYAALSGDLDIFKYVEDKLSAAKQEAVLDVKDYKNLSLAHYAEQAANPRVLHYLLEKKSKAEILNESDELNHSVAYYLAKKARLDILKKAFEINTALVLKDPEIALAAAASGDIATLEFLLNKYPSLLQKKDNRGQTLAHYAVKSKKRNLMEFVLAWDKQLLLITDHNGLSLAHLAAAVNSVEILKYLERQDQTIFQTCSLEGEMPVHSAASTGAEQALRFILEKHPSQIHVKNKVGKTLAHCAAESGDVNTLTLVKEKMSNWDEVMAKDSNFKTIASYAASSNNVEMLKEVLSWNGTLIDEVDVEDNTMAHYAVRSEQSGMLELVLNKKPDLIGSLDKNGMNIAHCAARNGRLEALKFILSKNEQLLKSLDKWDFSLALCAALGGSFAVVKHLLELNHDMQSFFFQKKGRNRAALHQVALSSGNWALFQYLVNVHKQPVASELLAFYALHSEKVFVIKQILTEYPDCSTETWGQRSLVHEAAFTGRVEILQYLLELEPKSALKKSETLHYTIANYALMSGYSEMVDYVWRKYPELFKNDRIVESACLSTNPAMLDFVVTHQLGPIRNIAGTKANIANLVAEAVLIEGNSSWLVMFNKALSLLDSEQFFCECGPNLGECITQLGKEKDEGKREKLIEKVTISVEKVLLLLSQALTTNVMLTKLGFSSEMQPYLRTDNARQKLNEIALKLERNRVLAKWLDKISLGIASTPMTFIRSHLPFFAKFVPGGFEIKVSELKQRRNGIQTEQEHKVFLRAHLDLVDAFLKRKLPMLLWDNPAELMQSYNTRLGQLVKGSPTLRQESKLMAAVTRPELKLDLLDWKAYYDALKQALESENIKPSDEVNLIIDYLEYRHVVQLGADTQIYALDDTIDPQSRDNVIFSDPSEENRSLPSTKLH